MNTFRNYFWVLLLASLAACEKNTPEPVPEPQPEPEKVKPEIKVSSGSQTVFSSGLVASAAGETFTVKFSATDNWSSEITESQATSWLKISPSSGKSGEVTMTVTAEVNKSEEDRTATVKLICGTDSKSFTVKQAVPLFSLTPQQVTLGPEVVSFEVEVKSTLGYKVSSTPEWITENGVETPEADRFIHTFSVEPNKTGASRTSVIVFCNDNNTCVPVTVTQEPVPEEPSEEFSWDKNFYHRSLFMRFTATWCGYCPTMAKTVKLAQEQHPDKLELVNLHGAGSDLVFSKISPLQSQYRIQGYPSGIVDGRRLVENYSSDYAAQLTGGFMQETEENYPVSSTFGFNSFFEDRMLTVDLRVYFRYAGDYKVTILLLESGIVGYQADFMMGDHDDYVHNDVARMAFTEVKGNPVSVKTDQYEWPGVYTLWVPESYNLDNLKILVYVQRAYGSQQVLASGKYGDYYVDNAGSAKAGASFSPSFVK